MGSATNRNLQAKFEKAKVQRIDAGVAEYSKPAYRNDRTPYVDPGVLVQRVEPAKKLHVRMAVVDPHCHTPHRPTWDNRQHETEYLVHAVYVEAKPLRGKAALRARLRQHF